MPPEPTAASTPNRPAGLNRSLLTVIGLVALLVGAYVVLRGTGALGGLGGLDPQGSLLPAGLSPPTWVTYVVVVAAVIIGLLCLRWLVAQTGRRAGGTTWWFPDDRDRGRTTMHSGAATDAFAAEVGTYSGVHSAGAVLTGDRTRPELHVSLGLTDQARVADLRERIDGQALPRLCQALELESLPTEILVRLGAATDTTRTR